MLIVPHFQSLLSDLDDLKRELQIVLEETAKVDRELSEEEDEQKYCLQTELEQQLDMCRMKLEAERDALWQLVCVMYNFFIIFYLGKMVSQNFLLCFFSSQSFFTI